MTSTFTRESPLEPIETMLTQGMIDALQPYGIGTFGALADRLQATPDLLRDLLIVQDQVIAKLTQLFTEQHLFAASSPHPSRKKGVIDQASQHTVGFDGQMVNDQEFQHQKKKRNAHKHN